MKVELFPIQNSTLSAEALVPWVLKKYDLPKPISCEFFRKGICDTYIIKTAQADRFLKIYMHGRRTRLDVTEEVRLLNYLSKNRVSVAKPIARKDGSYVNQLMAPEGVRYAVLFEAAEGVEEDNDENRIKAYGEMVARFHQCSDRMRGPYRRKHLDMKHLVDNNLAAISPLMAHRPADFKLIENVGDECKRRISDLLPTSKPEYGICHGDLHGGDVRYGEDNTPVLFDFDSSGCGWRALDIGVFLATSQWMDISGEAEDRRQGRLATFLRGYSSHRKLSENELSAIQLAPPIHHIFLMGHVLRYTAIYEGEHWANNQFIDWHMNWFRYWAEKDS
ncbi:phosphotransferase [bacterium]|nr:phosphotransferase [bacterium]